MRRSIAILLSVLLVLSCFALTACGKSEDLSGSKYVGTWKVDSLSFKDEEGELEGDYILTVNGDGSAQFVSEEGTSNCTWKLTKDGFKTKGDAKLKFTDDGDGIKAKILGAYLHFVRVPDGTTLNTYGYAGNDAWEAAIYRYLATELAPQHFEAGEDICSVPVVRIIDAVEAEDGGCDVWGDFDVYNYKIAGETLNCVSGGNFPGKMHVAENDDGYAVTDFTVVEDGANYDPSAKEIFGDRYEEFISVNSDDEGRNSARKDALAYYVKSNGLSVIQYQDYGWDPVKLFE